MFSQNLTPANTNTFECGGKTWKCEGSIITATCTGGKMTCGSGEPKEVVGGGGSGGGGGGSSSKKSGAVAVRGSLLWIVAAVQVVKKFLS